MSHNFGLNAAPAHPREILKTSILSNASCVMLVHTHPSGNLTPSQQDVALTDRMQRVYTELGIPLVDHIILGRNGQYYSFRNKEIMPAYRPIYETDIDSFEIMSVAEQRESIRGQIREAEREIRSTEQKESSRPVYNRHVKRAAHER